MGAINFYFYLYIFLSLYSYLFALPILIEIDNANNYKLQKSLRNRRHLNKTLKTSKKTSLGKLL